MIAKPERWFVLVLFALSVWLDGRPLNAATDSRHKKSRDRAVRDSLLQPPIVTGSAKDSHTSWPCAYSIYRT